MSLIKRKECKTKADYRVVTCPNCGARIEIKTMERRYMVSLLFLVVIFASIIYLNRNIAPTSSTSLSSSGNRRCANQHPNNQTFKLAYKNDKGRDALALA